MANSYSIVHTKCVQALLSLLSLLSCIQIANFLHWRQNHPTLLLHRQQSRREMYVQAKQAFSLYRTNFYNATEAQRISVFLGSCGIVSGSVSYTHLTLPT